MKHYIKHYVELVFSISLLLIVFGCATSPKPSDVKQQDVKLDTRPGFESEKLPSKLEALLSQALQLTNSNNFEQADTLLSQASLEFPNYPQIELNRVLIALKKDDLLMAQSHLDAAFKSRNDYAPSLNLQGVIYRLDGRFNEAESAYQKAISLEPNYALAYLNLGILFDLYLQKSELALAAFNKYIELAGEDEKVSNWIVEIKTRLGVAE